jgi:hypothetical protein
MMTGAFSAAAILALSINWFCTALSSTERTLSLALSASSNVALPPVSPGKVPRMNWSFSPSALRIWLMPSSSMAMDESTRFMASARSMGGLTLGKVGYDMLFPPR